MYSIRQNVCMCRSYSVFDMLYTCTFHLRASPPAAPICLPIMLFMRRRDFRLTATALIGGPPILEPNKSTGAPTPVPRCQEPIGSVGVSHTTKNPTHISHIPPFSSSTAHSPAPPLPFTPRPRSRPRLANSLAPAEEEAACRRRASAQDGGQGEAGEHDR
jgi:hypothetical protein